jgi:hypothetical protein
MGAYVVMEATSRVTRMMSVKGCHANCRKMLGDSPAHYLPRCFAKFIDRQHFAGVIGMFALDPILENRCVLHEIRGFAAVHVISTLATGKRAGYTLRIERTPALLNLLLKLLFGEHIGSVGLCHLSSLPQLSGRWLVLVMLIQLRPFQCRALANRASPDTNEMP